MEADTAMLPYTLYERSPEAVVSPAGPEELAAFLRVASERGQAVVPWGGGTRQHLSASPTHYNLALLTRQLKRVLAYHPEDLVITVEAGITLGALQAILLRHGQWLPWDVPLAETASVGGLLASGASGPLRLGYGAPRDWTLGMRVALGDGRLVRSGGSVVKNVAGYDSHKLQIGAYGTLGVITEVSFKLQPLPEQRRTLLAAFTSPRLPAQAVSQLRAAPLQPAAIVVLNRVQEARLPALRTFSTGQPAHLVVIATYIGPAAAVTRQIREAVRRCVEVGARTIELHDGDDSLLWTSLANVSAPLGDGSLLVRAAMPGAAIAPVAGTLERIANRMGQRPAQLAIEGPGVVFSRWQLAGQPVAVVRALLAEARAAMIALGGYLVVEEAPSELGFERWGPEPTGIALMRSLRARWDPAGILNPGRYLV